MCTVLTKSANRAVLTAIGPPKPCGADARPVDGRALGVILAVTLLAAALPVCVEWARPRTRHAVPACLAVARSRPWVAHVSVVRVTLADALAARAEQPIGARPLGAVRSFPAIRALAGAVDGRALRAVLAGAVLGTVGAELPSRAGLQAPVSPEAGRALTGAGDVVAGRSVEAVAPLAAVGPPHAGRAAVGTHRARPAGGAVAEAGGGAASPSVLAAALRLALLPVLALGAQVLAQGSSPARRTVAGA